MKASCIVVDDGEVTFEECLKSLRNQSVRDIEIIVAPTENTNLEVARKYADIVLEPMRGIGRQRVAAILKASSNYIISCDSDSIYDVNYVKYALEDLKLFPVVKAGTILPLKPSILGYVESLCSPVIPYEFSLCFRKDVFLQHGIHLLNYDVDPRRDIGPPLMFKVGFVNDPRLVVWTRFPTKGANMVANEYLLSMVFAAIPGSVIGGSILYDVFRGL